MGIISNKFYSLFMYNIGDIVVVVDSGQTYSSYKGMFEWFGLKNKNYNPEFANKTIAKVINFREHEFQSYETCIFIKDSKDNECVIEQKGLRHATEEDKLRFSIISILSQNKQSDEIPTIKLKRFQINII